jgi:hypothetical protein
MPDDPPHAAQLPVLPEPIPPEGTPQAELCQWARDGLKNAMSGMSRAGGGIKRYQIGTRSLEYAKPGEQLDVIAWWQRQVEFYCGIPAPATLSGQDSACRIIPRDV